MTIRSRSLILFLILAVAAFVYWSPASPAPASAGLE